MCHKGRRGLGRCLGSTTKVRWECWWSLMLQTAPPWRLPQSGSRTWTERYVLTSDAWFHLSCWPTNVTSKEETDETCPSWTPSVRRTASVAGLRLLQRCVNYDAYLSFFSFILNHHLLMLSFLNMYLPVWYYFALWAKLHLSHDTWLAFNRSCRSLLIKCAQILTGRNHLLSGFCNLSPELSGCIPRAFNPISSPFIG